MKRALLPITLAALLAIAGPGAAQIRGGGGGARGGGGGFAGAGRGGGSGFVGGGASRSLPPMRTAPPISNPYNQGPVPFSAGAVGGINAGFGSVVFPGGTSSFGSVVSPIYSNNATFASRLGAVVSGSPSSIIAPRQNFIGSNYTYGYGGRSAVYPVFVGGGYGYGYQEPTNITVINAPPVQPPVIINQNYTPDPPANPVMRVYGNSSTGGITTVTIPAPSNPEGNPLPKGAIDIGDNSVNPTDEPTVYLIALTDGTIYASYAYWVEHDTLHYITPGHAHNQISLDRVDKDLSRRLNRERKLDFSVR